MQSYTNSTWCSAASAKHSTCHRVNSSVNICSEICYRLDRSIPF